MKTFLKYLLIAFGVLVVITTFVFLFNDSKKEPVVYEELEVKTMDIIKTSVVTGKIEPRNEVNIKPQINGIIAELYKESGQEVKENDVIAKLKVIPDMTSLSSAQSRVRLAEINLHQAQTNYNREKQLYDKNLISAEEYDKVLQALNQAKEEKSGAQDALEVIRDGVSSSNATSSSTLVRSTITGLILDIPVKVGNSVIQANTMNDGTTVATVANMNDLIFNGTVDETEVGTIVEGTPVKIKVGALQDFSLDAILEYISPKATESNGAKLFQIKAAVQIPEDNVMIRSGYSANAEIILKRAENVLAVSESALVFEDEETYVYLKSGDEFKKTLVETGLSDGLNIEILSGLKEGDIVRGNQIIDEEK